MRRTVRSLILVALPDSEMARLIATEERGDGVPDDVWAEIRSRLLDLALQFVAKRDQEDAEAASKMGALVDRQGVARDALRS